MRRAVVSSCALTLLASAMPAAAAFVSTSPHALGGGRAYQHSGAPAHFISPFFDIFMEVDLTSMSGPAVYGDPDRPVIVGYVGQGAAEIRAWSGAAPPGAPGRPSADSRHEPRRRRHPREPTLASTGLHDIDQVGRGGGAGQALYEVSSFCDVFLELSVDGGQTWSPADDAVRLTMVPVPGAAGLVALGGLFASRLRRS